MKPIFIERLLRRGGLASPIWLESLADIPSLRDFSCHEIPWDFWYRARNTHNWSGIDATITNLLCNVQSLSLTVSFGYLGDFRGGNALWRLFLFVQTSTQLKKLYLDFQRYAGKSHEAEPPDGWGRYGPNQDREHWFKDLTNISPLMERLRLPNIRTFHICHCEFSQGAFIGFMRNHYSTLKELYLKAIQLSQSGQVPNSWSGAIWNVAGMLALEKAGLDGLQDNFIEARRKFDDPLQERDDAVPKQQRFLCDLTSYLLQQGRTSRPSWPE